MATTTEAVSQSSKSYASLIPRPIDVVTTGLNYLTKQGHTASSTANNSNHKNGEESYQRGDGVADCGKESSLSSLEEWAPSGYSSDQTSQQRGGSKEEGDISISTKLSSSKSPFSSTQGTTLERHDADSTLESSSEATPGRPTPPSLTQPPLTAKSPLEIWQDRVEQCQKRLPEGLLSFFTHADTLGNCSVVNDMLQVYESGTGSDDMTYSGRQ